MVTAGLIGFYLFCWAAPLMYAIEWFGKLGFILYRSYLCVQFLRGGYESVAIASRAAVAAGRGAAVAMPCRGLRRMAAYRPCGELPAPWAPTNYLEQSATRRPCTRFHWRGTRLAGCRCAANGTPPGSALRITCAARYSCLVANAWRWSRYGARYFPSLLRSASRLPVAAALPALAAFARLWMG